MNRYATMVSLLLMGFAAMRAGHAESVTTYGAGLRSCQTYLDARAGNVAEEVTFVDWLGGYFSAANRTSRHRNNILGMADLKASLERLDDSCRARPHLHFAEAAGLMLLSEKPGPAAHAIEVTAYGSADKACHLFVEARQQRETAYWGEFLQWLGGYLSGVNAMSLRTNNVLGTEELVDAMQWLDRFCSVHPTTTFVAAADALIAATGDPQSERPGR